MRDCRTHMQWNPKYLSRFSTHAMNEIVKSLNDEQREAVARMGFREHAGVENLFFIWSDSPVGEKVSPYQNRRTLRIVDWSQDAINKRESVNEIGRDVELPQSKMIEELHRFMSFHQ
ncbi:hypothetical protein M9H77_18984 [Catharanthus roseus]|uniref:Uncharacterized protein n=1 Tax=Catharanthus roseus TaxID=4058 RepID=A0ACC0B912_CATRO|nr:hypothetical protein M9H77_18984 [Catharanthus roseus]